MTNDAEPSDYVPESCQPLLDASEDELKSALPEIARDSSTVTEIRRAVESFPTEHAIHQMDARKMTRLDEQVDLIVTSPPYFDLKEYNDGGTDGQLGSVDDYEAFSEMLKEVWEACYAQLRPGGRMCVVVGDVLRSRREHGRHRVLPLHSRIQEQATEIGFDTLAPIFWYKIGNASLESGDSARFLGKPYEPGAVVKNDVEYVLNFRKPGSYRSPSTAERILSVIGEDAHRQYFRQVWDDVTGAQRDDHPAPFPEKLAKRLIRMYSFVGDTVLDPFAGTGTTAAAASSVGRDSISIEIEDEYVDIIKSRVSGEQRTLSSYKYGRE